MADLNSNNVPSGYLEYMGAFGEHIDTLEQQLQRKIPYKSTEWYAFYLCYMAGRLDAVRDENASLTAEVGR